MLKSWRPTLTVTIKFMHELFERFGYPETIVTDNATLFTSKDFRIFWEVFAIKHITTPPFHPRSNGFAERFVNTLKRALKKYGGRLGRNKNLRIPSTISYHTKP